MFTFRAAPAAKSGLESRSNKIQVLYVFGPDSVGKSTLRSLVNSKPDFYYFTLSEHLQRLKMRPDALKSELGGASHDDVVNDNITAGQMVAIVKDKICKEFLRGSKVFIIEGFPTTNSMAAEFERTFKKPQACLLLGVDGIQLYAPPDPLGKVVTKYRNQGILRRPRSQAPLDIKGLLEMATEYE